MNVCHICGSQNDPANRFCDQCGARIDDLQTKGEDTRGADLPSASQVTCSACGAPALPGQAFCDHCGQDLREVSISSLPPAQEVSGESAPSPIPPQMKEVADSDETVSIGDVSMPTMPVSSEPVTKQPVIEEQPAIPPQPEEKKPFPAQTVEEPISFPESHEGETISVTPPVGPTEDTVVPSHSQVPIEETPVSPPEEDHARQVHAERQKLEEEIARHQATVSQMEHLIQNYPAGSAPSYLTMGLESARNELHNVQQKFATLQARAKPDLARVARLKQLINVHHDTIAQFEQMQKGYPPDAVPSFLVEGIREARRAVTQAEAELAKLQGTSPLPTSAVASPGLEKALLLQKKGPRLVLFEGKHDIAFPKDKTEFIIGREDPVSQIFPEIDLTSFGGEAGGVSRQHARISHQNGLWTVTDLDSTNHTRVDGVKIEPNVPVPIQDGSRLQFGRIVAIFHL